MSKKIISALLFIVFSSIFANAGGVTNITEVVNNTGFVVEVRKYDTQPLAAGIAFETTKEIPADGGMWSGDMWIPWADKSDDFGDKRLEIIFNGKPLFWIWQSGEFVLYNNRARFVGNAPRVFGEAKSGGERRLIISMNGKRPVFDFRDSKKRKQKNGTRTNANFSRFERIF